MKPDTKDHFNIYLDKWRAIFKRPLKVAWNEDQTNGWLDNDYCADCRYCCGPQDSDEPFPMALLPCQITERTPDDFYMLDSQTACLTRAGCKSLGRDGCSLNRSMRPPACGLFPIVLVNGKLYLYKTCPAVIFNTLDSFIVLAAQAARWLGNFTEKELRHISLSLPVEKLSRDYIDLGIRLF